MGVESANRSWWGQAYRSVQSIPVDLLAVFGFVVLLDAVLLIPPIRDATLAGASVRTLLGIPTLLFLPGYVVVSIVYPRRATAAVASSRLIGQQSGRDERRGSSIDLSERLALAFGMSVAFLPLFGIVLGTWWRITFSSVLTGLSVFLLGGAAIAAARRLRVPPAARFGPTLDQVTVPVSRSTRRREGLTGRLSTVLLGIAVVVAVGSIGFAVATPYQSGSSSTLYLVTENESGSQLASGYPTTFTVGEPQELTVGIENDEERRQAYTVVLELERVQNTSTGPSVVESQSVTRLHPVVADGETWTGPHDVTPELVGQDLRLHYYLYRGDDAPATPDEATAYQDVYIWIDVTGAS